MTLLRPLWLAVQFLTPLPVPSHTLPTPQEWGRSTLAYPLVGLALGVILVALHWIFQETDAGVQAALLLGVWTLLSGGRHLRGLADSADAWAGGQGDRERTFKIIKDPRSGPVALTMVVLVMLTKFATLQALVVESAWAILLIAPVLGRSAMIALLLSTPYLHTRDAGLAYATHLPRPAAVWVLLGVGAGTLILFGAGGGWLWVLFALGIYIPRAMMIRRLGGATDETISAICELMEAGMLMAVVLIWG